MNQSSRSSRQELGGEVFKGGAGGKKQETAQAEALAQLTAMGFTKSQAKRALQATSNNLVRAANWLLTGLSP